MLRVNFTRNLSFMGLVPDIKGKDSFSLSTSPVASETSRKF